MEEKSEQIKLQKHIGSCSRRMVSILYSYTEVQRSNPGSNIQKFVGN